MVKTIEIKMILKSKDRTISTSIGENYQLW